MERTSSTSFLSYLKIKKKGAFGTNEPTMMCIYMVGLSSSGEVYS